MLGQRWGYNWCEDRAATEETIVDELTTALALDDNDSDVHRIPCCGEPGARVHDQAVYHQQRAEPGTPTTTLVVVQQGEILTWHGQPEEGAGWILRAMRPNPYHPRAFLSHLARAHFRRPALCRRPDAIKRIGAPTRRSSHCLPAARPGTAIRSLRRRACVVCWRTPPFTLEDHRATLHYRHAADPEQSP
ncbi:MAG: hypothetical protein IPG91_06710 [Ideonella sp.]|nr:hypothetical protein [Ideonella sp.]